MLINCAKAKNPLCVNSVNWHRRSSRPFHRASALFSFLSHTTGCSYAEGFFLFKGRTFGPTVAKHLLRFLSSIDGCLACDIKCFQHTVVVNLQYINKTEENKIWDLQVKATPHCRRHFCRRKKFPVWSLCEKGWWSCLPRSVDLRCTTQMQCCASQTLTNKSL